jgi:integrase/recombinase XerD
MSTDTTVSQLRQRMIEDMAARKLGPHSQRSHIHSCKRFAAFLKRCPDTATADDIRRFQLHLIEAGLSIGNRNRIMSGVKFLFRVTLRRHDLAAEIYHLKEPQKLPLTMSPEEVDRLLTSDDNEGRPVRRMAIVTATVDQRQHRTPRLMTVQLVVGATSSQTA